MWGMTSCAIATSYARTPTLTARESSFGGSAQHGGGVVPQGEPGPMRTPDKRFEMYRLDEQVILRHSEGSLVDHGRCFGVPQHDVLYSEAPRVLFESLNGKACRADDPSRNR